MWVRTTLRIERWTKEKTEDDTSSWDESSTGKEGAWQIRGGLPAGGRGTADWPENPRRGWNLRARRKRRGQRLTGADLGPGGGFTRALDQ